MQEIESLNERQKEAVLQTEGPVMVMAGAGSGKTRVLTLRIAHLINDCSVSPLSILAVTFTNKAAREMKERVQNYVECNTSKMWISTFHSMCARILRMEIDNLPPYNKNYTTIDEEDSVKIISDIIKDFNIDSKKTTPKAAKAVISSFKNDMISSINDNSIKRIYNEYQNRLRHDNLLDFDDLILVTIDLFTSNPSILRHYQDKFSYIMVDEFQDTNSPQYKLIKLLGYNHTNVFIVGDQDQSIYSFRGAKVENIDRFVSDFVGAKIIMLEQNYRSTKPILNAANEVIKNNTNRYKKNLFTIADKGELPGYYHADSSYDEVMFVIDKIKELKQKGYNYNDFAIIYRANFVSRNFEDMFVRYNIPYVIYGGLSFFQRKEIKDMVAYLRVITSKDDFSLKRIINEPKRKIGPAMLERLQEAADKNLTCLFDAIDFLPKSGQGYTSLIDFKFTILELYESLIDESKDITNIIDVILDKTGYYKMLKDEGETGKDRLENIKEFKTVLKEADEFYEGSRVEKLEALLQELALKTNLDDKDESIDKVKMMTYHQAKGLEYPVVFLVAFEEGIFPSANSFSLKELEEERRICYVGITRAKERLYITNARVRMLFGQTRMSEPSRYIKEIGANNFNNLKQTPKVFATKKEEKPKTSISNIKEVVKTDLEFKVGDKINHKAFGDGTVVEVNGDIISVIFSSNFGKKKLMANHPSIRKI